MPQPMLSCSLSALLLSCAAMLNAAAEPTAKSSTFDPHQLPMVRGVVAHYTLVPHGAVDGFILEDSTQVLAVPIFSDELLAKIHPGDSVTVYGLKASNKALVLAMAVTNDKSQESVLFGEIPLMLAMGRSPSHQAPRADDTSAPDAKPQPASRAGQFHGIVEQTIYGPLGTVSGALLRDGLVLRIASTEGERAALLLKAGKMVWATGQLSESSLGRLLLVEALGTSAEQLTRLAPWDGPQ